MSKYEPDWAFETEALLPMPAHPEAEKLILGAVMLDGSIFPQISAALTAEDFSIEKHRRIFGRMIELDATGEPIDRITVAHALHQAGQLESVDGLTYLTSMDDGGATSDRLDAYVRIVQDRAVLRKCALECQRTIAEALGRGAESGLVIGRLRALTETLQQAIATGDIPSAEEIAEKAGISAIFGGGTDVLINTPWSGLNGIIGGFERGQMIVIGARPSQGKTVMACQIAMHAAELGKNSVIFSLEMSGTALIQRLIASKASIPLHAIRGGYIDRQDRARAQEALHGICQLGNLRIGDDSRTKKTIPQMRSALAHMQRKHKIDLVVIDYLQMMEAIGRHSNRTAEVSEISRGVKLLAQEFNCALVVASQFSRDSEKESREPRLSDLRESGSIEQDADIVIFPYRISGQDPEEKMVSSHFIVAKQRNGRLARTPVVFEKPFVRFVEAA